MYQNLQVEVCSVPLPLLWVDCRLGKNGGLRGTVLVITAIAAGIIALALHLIVRTTVAATKK